MNIPVIIIEMAAFAALFTIIVFKTTGRKTTTQVHNYPPDIHEEYFKTHERIPTEPLSKRVIVTKSAALLCFVVLLVIMAILAGAKTFTQGFRFAFGMMALIGAYLGKGYPDEYFIRTDRRVFVSERFILLRIKIGAVPPQKSRTQLFMVVPAERFHRF